jgi:hypothetical protein
MHNTTQLITELAQAVAQRKPLEGQHNGLTISVWYDQAIPVVTVIHPESGVIFEELASDKPSVMAQMLAPWLNSA